MVVPRIILSVYCFIYRYAYQYSLSVLSVRNNTRMRAYTTDMPDQCLSDVRLCVTGGSSVGKSAITVRFLTRRFIGEYQQDVEQTYKGLIDFGPDTIKYDLKDTGRSPDESLLSTWPTCIAVIYSINDKESFTTASKLLDNIDRSVRENVDSSIDVPSLALIGNKSDLEHLRDIREVEGQRLADKHGAAFWETSASEDYHSAFRPLSSLIIRSFLKRKKSSSSPYASSTEEDDFESLLQRYSEPTNNTSRLVSVPQPPTDYQWNTEGHVLRNNLTAPSSSSTRKTIKRRKKLREFKSKPIDKMVSNSSTSSLSSTQLPPSAPTKCIDSKFTVNNITIEVTDTSNGTKSSTKMRDWRSQSLPKTGSSSFSSSSRLIQRKGKGTRKQESTSENTQPMGIEKSHSLTDLKTFQLLSVDSASSGISSANSELGFTSGESGVELNTLGRSNSMNALLGRSQSMHHSSSNGRLNIPSVLKSLNRSNSFRHAASTEDIEDEKYKSKEKLKSMSSTSFTTIEQKKTDKNFRSRLQNDRQKPADMFPFERTPDNFENFVDGGIARVPGAGYGLSSSKSMRKKICSMFRTRSLNESTD